MATPGRPAEDVGLRTLMAVSPESPVHMSVAAEAALLLGLGAVMAAPFSAFFSVTLVLGVLSLGCGVAAMVTTRAPDTAGSAVSTLGLALAVLALVLVGLRYAGLDTAFGDDVAPWLLERLQSLNSRLPQPG
ncbi:MAG TPA: hypothetical protein VNP20_24300 [Nocardioidaceae bacterium]|nr:hypothetical protein [Nocardioidaceae bacterium]